MRQLAAGLAAGAMVLALAAQAGAQISGSAHDFSDANGWQSGVTEICVFCHTPHNASTTVEPLWNHALSAATYTTYASSTLDATVGTPSGASSLCLSCHDGTVAVDSYGGVTGTNFMGTVNAAANFGTDLSNDHPISFTYNTALVTADGGLNDPTTSPVADLLYGAGSDQVECASCHDVHNGLGQPNLLVMSNVGSALCLTCHSK